MRRIICMLLVLSLAVPLLAEDLPDSLFPWGAYSNYREDASERDEMRDSLGFNIINLAWDSRDDDNVVDFMNDGFFVYPNVGPKLPGDPTNYFKYAEAHYSKIWANDESSRYRFWHKDDHGFVSFDGFFAYEYVASDTTVVVLDTLWMMQQEKNAALEQDPIRYYRKLRMRIDPTGVPPDTVVAILITYNCEYLGRNRTPMDSVFITAGEFSDSTPVLVNCGYYTRGDDRTGFGIVSTCKTEVYFDYLKIYCAEGEQLIDVGFYDEKIMQSAATLFAGENVAGWYLADEPVYDQFRPMAHIDALIMEATDDSLDWPDTARVVTAWNKAFLNLTGDFINIAKPEVVWADLYEYYGGQTCSDTCDTTSSTWAITDYTGSYDSSFGGYWHRGEQSALNRLAENAGKVNEACRSASLDWWLMPQAFGYMYYTYGCRLCDDLWYFRLPTKSELTCNVFIGLCNGSRGIVFWKYHGNDTETVYAPGLVYPGDDSVTAGWYAVKEMAPYIEAIGQTMRELEWEAAFSCSLSSQTFSGYVNSLSGYSESTNPDSGWFQVGEFSDGTDPYIIVVNRACNIDSVTLAPDVECVVRLNPSAVGSDYVYIIDLADTVRLAGADSGWVGIPDTTYSAKLNGTIPFTTVLGPGEGRLFKIVETVQQ